MCQKCQKCLLLETYNIAVSMFIYNSINMFRLIHKLGHQHLPHAKFSAIVG